MARPFIIYIAAGAFILTATLVIIFLVKEGIKNFSQGDNNQNPR